MEDSTKGTYSVIVGRYLWTELGWILKFSEHVIKSDDGCLMGDTASMAGLGACVFKDLYTGEIKPEELCTEAYIKEVYES